jgi:hypothetical protein
VVHVNAQSDCGGELDLLNQFLAQVESAANDPFG